MHGGGSMERVGEGWVATRGGRLPGMDGPGRFRAREQLGYGAYFDPRSRRSRGRPAPADCSRRARHRRSPGKRRGVDPRYGPTSAVVAAGPVPATAVAGARQSPPTGPVRRGPWCSPGPV
ncbi:hypothetical protein T261_00686 [Streptomyces lydicus]|nr:hypothetical protein T261_00686 [Streptomyces lydicus]